MKDLEDSLKMSFGKIETQDLKTIIALFKPEVIHKGKYFLKTGRFANKLSYIKSGFLRIFAESDKKEITQWISTNGYFVTDLASFINDTPARWTIQALEDTEIYSIHKEDYNNIRNLIPEWNYMEKIFIVHCFSTLEDRVFSHLSMTAEERYNIFFENNKELFNQVPLQYIASILGMTPETFSRIRKKQLP